MERVLQCRHLCRTGFKRVALIGFWVKVLHSCRAALNSICRSSFCICRSSLCIQLRWFQVPSYNFKSLTRPRLLLHSLLAPLLHSLLALAPCPAFSYPALSLSCFLLPPCSCSLSCLLTLVFTSVSCVLAIVLWPLVSWWPFVSSTSFWPFAF